MLSDAAAGEDMRGRSRGGVLKWSCDGVPGGGGRRLLDETKTSAA